MSDEREKLAFQLKDAAKLSAILVCAMMKSVPDRLNSAFKSGAVPEPRIAGEDGQVFDCLYQYHAYLWGKYGKERADKMVDDFKKEVKAALEGLFADKVESSASPAPAGETRKDNE